MQLRQLFLVLCALSLFSFGGADITSNILTGFKNNDSKSISKHFASSLNLSINKEENVYTKFQAEMLLVDFFRNNKTVSVKNIQRAQSSDNSNKFLIYSLKTNVKSYRVFIKLLEVNGDIDISELRIE